MKITYFLRQAVASSLIQSVVATCAMSGLLMHYGTKANLTNEQWASWVQAVGSISAILVTLGLASHQNLRQKRLEHARDAANDLRIAMFAAAVTENCLSVVRVIERTQKGWPSEFDYSFHERSRLQSAERLAQTVASGPMFRELISPMMRLLSLLVTVEAAAESLTSTNGFKRNSKFVQFWEHTSAETTRIDAEVRRAAGLAEERSEIAELSVKHF